ncbi:MAG: putative sugar nucleotidyl transferase [Phycisphaeraceae bacterium]
MAEPSLAIFDDGGGHWGPLIDTRAIFDLRTGAATTIERIERCLGQPAAALYVPRSREALVREQHDGCAVNHAASPGPWRLVSGRWPGHGEAERVAALAPGQALVQADGQLVAACVDADRVADVLDTAGRGLELQRVDAPLLIERPWHVLDRLEALLIGDLAATDVPRLDPARFPIVSVHGEHPVHIHPSVEIVGPIAIDVRAGRVVIDRDALVHPFAALQGPCYVGPGSELGAHATLRRLTALGPRCRVAGELAVTIIQGHTNKAHSGYLGSAIVGSWCNLGAGTEVSNLKNTLGEVRVQLDPDMAAEPTGRTRQGPILGDYVRTAIGTRLMTGSVVGTGCMIAVSSYAPKLAPHFGFYTDAGRAEHDLDAFFVTAERMRKRPLTDAERAALQRLHGKTA